MAKRFVECTKCRIAKSWCFEGSAEVKDQETRDCPLIKLATGELKVTVSGYVET